MVLGVAAPYVLRPTLVARLPHPILTATTARDNWENKRAGDPEPSGACKDATQKLLLQYEKKNCDPDELITHCVGAVMRSGCEKNGDSDALVTLSSFRKESPP